MTPKQALVAHMRDVHGFSHPAGTHNQLKLNHKKVHTSNVYLTHTHEPDGWVDGSEQIPVRIFLSPPKNPNASRNQDRNWVLNIANKTKGTGYRYEMAGTSAGFPEEAQIAANKILGWTANWVAVGWGFEHQEPDIHSLVGYEARLHKMPRQELLTEARRVGLAGTPHTKEAVIAAILKAQGIDDEIIRNPPPPKGKPRA